jgi:hypothetical protein
MSSIRPTIRLSDLVGKLYTHECERKEVFWQQVNQRAAAAALKDPKVKFVRLKDDDPPVSPDDPGLSRDSAKKLKRLVANRRRRLKQVSEGTVTTAELRGRDAGAFEILQKHVCVAHAELLNEEVHKGLKEGGAEAALKPAAWKYAVAELSKVAPISITPEEQERYSNEEAYEQRVEKLAAKVRGGESVAGDELAAEFARLDREGYTETFLAELWDKYPNDAVDAKLPKPSDGGKPDAPDNVSVTPINDDSHLSTARLAKVFRVPANALRIRLNRWRAKNDADWVENPDRRPRETKYLYRVGSVRHVIDTLRATSETTSERPAKSRKGQ